MKKNRKPGFTLIELLVVIAVIGLLSSLVVVSVGGARGKARDSRRQSDMKQITSAQELYYNDNRVYYSTSTFNYVPAIPNYLPRLDDPRCPGGVCGTGAQDYTWIANIAAQTCGSVTLGAGQWYCVFARLENKPTTCGSTYYYFIASHVGTEFFCGAANPVVCDCF